MRPLLWAALVTAVLATLAPMAHVLELPNKLRLDGPLWLAVQQQLYRGWGPFLGAPTEIAALTITAALLAIGWRDVARRRALLVAAIAYVSMIVVFFVFNAPINAAVDAWTPASLPPDWPSYRLRWEIGHALAALFSFVGLIALVRAP